MMISTFAQLYVLVSHIHQMLWTCNVFDLLAEYPLPLYVQRYLFITMHLKFNLGFFLFLNSSCEFLILWAATNGGNYFMNTLHTCSAYMWDCTNASLFNEILQSNNLKIHKSCQKLLRYHMTTIT